MSFESIFKLSSLAPYASATSDYKETLSKVVDLSVVTPLKKGDLVVWSGEGKTCVKAAGNIAQGVLTAGEFAYKLSSWKGGHHVQISQRGKRIVPLGDLPKDVLSGDALTIKSGEWSKAQKGDIVYGAVGERQENSFVIDLFFLG